MQPTSGTHEAVTGSPSPVDTVPAATRSGVVTFLLTDIEGSTNAWDRDEHSMSALMAEHDRILAGAVARHDGIRPVEQGEGDSMVAVFLRAADAVAAATDAQRELQAELGERCRVRMAVHSGETLMRLDLDGATMRYAGPTIIRCARLRSCAHGGQLLVSSATAALVRGELPDGAGLDQLGTVILRGMAEPEPVFQLTHPDLQHEFPPLRGLDATPTTLPSTLTTFFGRQGELDSIAALLQTSRLVTITGTGGVGKTRVALQLGANLLDDHPAGVWWVALASAIEVEAMHDAVASGIGTSLAPSLPVEDQLGKVLAAEQPALLILDNCEHVLEPVGDLAQALLARCPQLTVLATSREPLGLPGERIWRLNSLSVPDPGNVVTASALADYDATALFVDRARSARPNLTYDTDACAHVVAICRRLDGVPLAIELAAARTRAMPLAALADGLERAFRLLTGGARTLLPRQQTLLASIAWSVDLLTEPERRALFRLAVFPEHFDLDAAESVAADGDLIDRFDVLDLVTALVDKSLLEFDPDRGGYRMLETIRQFGIERLAMAGELGDTRARHCRHWADVSRNHIEWTGPMVQFLRTYAADLFAAMEWALDTDRELAEQLIAQTGTAFGQRWVVISRLCAFLTEPAPSGGRGLHWPAAVAQMAVMAPIAGIFDIFIVVPEAQVLARERSDERSTTMFGLFDVFTAIALLDPRPGQELFERALAAGHLTPALMAASGIAPFGPALGWLDLHDRLAAIAHQHLGDHGFVNSAIAPAALRTSTARGELAQLGTIAAPRSQGSWPLINNVSAMAIAERALVTGDQQLLRHAESLVMPDDHPYSVDCTTYVRWVRHVWSGDPGRAAPGPWADGDRTLAVVVDGLALRWSTDPGAASNLFTRWQQLIDSIEIGAPLLEVELALCIARRELAAPAPDLAVVERSAYRALAISAERGLTLRTVDALETLAALELEAGDLPAAGRLAGAAQAARNRIGYSARWWSPLDETQVQSLRDAVPDEVDGAMGLSLTDAVTLATRGRGPRGRPSYGVEALTPTERSVAEHAARGSTTAEIARQLLVSPATVKTHLAHVFTKLGVRNRVELTARLAATDTRT